MGEVGDHWKGALTLGQVILKLVRDKKTDTKEFQALLKYYGKKKVRECYEAELKKEKE